jgi:hypothetical protein
VEAFESVNGFRSDVTAFFKKTAWPPQIRLKKTTAKNAKGAPFRTRPSSREDGF